MWLTGPVAPRHVGSSQTRARTCVPCISRQILNHWRHQGSPIISIFFEECEVKERSDYLSMVQYDLSSHEPLQTLFKVSCLQVCDAWDHVSDAERSLGMHVSCHPLKFTVHQRTGYWHATSANKGSVFFGGGNSKPT